MRSKKAMHSQRKQGQVTWVEYRDMVQKCRNGIRKARTQIERTWQGK